MSAPAHSRSIRVLLFSLTTAVALAGGSVMAVHFAALDSGDERVSRSPMAASRHPDRDSSVPIQSAVTRMPLYFIENKGQIDSRVRYYLPGTKTSAYFTPGGVTLTLSSATPSAYDKHSRPGGRPLASEPGRQWAVRHAFVGADPSVVPEGGELTPAIVSYFKGPQAHWKTNIPTRSSVVYRNLWPGIDLTYDGTGGRLKYSFLVHPGADLSRIRLAYRGAESIHLNAAGQLEVRTPAGSLKDDRPVSWQGGAGRRTAVQTSYSLIGSRTYGFRVDRYDSTRPLVIDPVILTYAGYIGGSSGDGAAAIAVDGNGAAYVTGYTDSTDFPVTPGSLDTIHNDVRDAFVAKVKADGTGLVYAAYIGGSGDDEAFGIAVDGNGAAYITGSTFSTEATFPETVGSFDAVHNGAEDAFVAKVNSAGTALTYAGYIGGSVDEEAYSIDVDGTGAAYVAGWTASTEATFPETVGSFDETYNGGPDDGFVAKVNTNGTALDFAGFIGGSEDDGVLGIAVGTSGNAFITGWVTSTESSPTPFPVTGGSIDTTHNGGGYDSFVARLNTSGSALDFAGYIGGSGSEWGNDIAVDGDGALYATGPTTSDQITFPETVGPDLTHNGSDDAFVAKVRADGAALEYAGYIGGAASDTGNGIALDPAGGAYVAGRTESNQSSFPEKMGPDLSLNGMIDAFAARVNSAGTALTYAGYIGGTQNDFANGIAVRTDGTAFVAGSTSSTQTSFPDKVGPDLSHNGSSDGFAAKITLKNLLKNGGFELDANNDDRPDNWTSNSRFTRDDGEVLSGNFAGRHRVGNDSSYTIQQAVAASAGKTYVFEGSVNVAPTFDPSFSFKLQMRWRNSSGGTISTKTIRTYTLQTGGWDLATMTLKAPSGTKSALVRMVVTSLNGTIYVDDFMLI